ncbi:(Fe-S)-binding protein [Desulfuribacillus stibiiarsenatis]|uniref:(Fe-S)-binding protein n=1 Tax=Desulfuribacillus stibiiarsenatis TaxID=1390249 RepID=A0A1E5L9Y3_9FIRM|nr:4Fe-4S dicluster domain-containing protein [Desulfuribacillus stibiiarsenatis]OEH86829.1 (Fe-S)-binding protein [Desulfuribacillus stibiiarsenatis]
MAKILQVADMHKCIGCYSCMLACARVVKKSLSPSRAALQVRTAGGFQSRFIAEICRGCIDAPCAAACNCGALTPREGGGVHFRPTKCIGCQDCVKACIVDVIQFDDCKKKPLICIQCGTCVRFCPHNVLEMEERKYDASGN